MNNLSPRRKDAKKKMKTVVLGVFAPWREEKQFLFDSFLFSYS